MASKTDAQENFALDFLTQPVDPSSFVPKPNEFDSSQEMNNGGGCVPGYLSP